jgi:arylsulfatase A-like enzyme
VILRGTEPEKQIDFTTAAFARETVRFIEKNKDKPWFVYLPFNAVHGPLEAPQGFFDKFSQVADEKRRIYSAMQTALDDAVGVVLSKLAELKLEEDTLVIFHSDNGGPTRVNTSSNAPLSGFKAQVMEGGVRIPFAIQWKGRLPAGKVYDAPIIQLDLQPTALAAAGVQPEANARFDGVNLLPYLTGEKSEAPHAALFWRFGKQRAVRSGDWKLTDMGSGAKLYNLKSDIAEQKDLAAENPAKLKELEAAYAEWDKGNVAPSWAPAPGSPGAAPRPARRANRGGEAKPGSVPAQPAKPASGGL